MLASATWTSVLSYPESSSAQEPCEEDALFMRLGRFGPKVLEMTQRI